MDIVSVRQELTQKLGEMKAYRAKLDSLVETKSKTIALHEKETAKVMMKLRHGEKMALDGLTIQNPPVTLIPKLAAGFCWKERFAREMAENEYKAVVVNIDALKTEINALQSIFRHQDDM